MAAGCGLLAASALLADEQYRGGVMGPTGRSESSRQPRHQGATEADVKTFIQNAALGNQTEMALADVAMQKSQNADIRSSAYQIRKDHEQANRDLQAIARNHGVTLSNTLDTADQRKVDALREQGPELLDKQFATEMMKSHQMTIARYERASRDLPDADVRQYATNYLPKLKDHMQLTRDVAREVGVDSNTIATYTRDITLPPAEERTTPAGRESGGPRTR